jgi:hypothetical protein
MEFANMSFNDLGPLLEGLGVRSVSEVTVLLQREERVPHFKWTLPRGSLGLDNGVVSAESSTALTTISKPPQGVSLGRRKS